MKLILTPNRRGTAVAGMTAVIDTASNIAPTRRYLAPGEIEIEAPCGVTIEELRAGARAMGAAFALFTVHMGGAQ
jgi:hypothetical protein